MNWNIPMKQVLYGGDVMEKQTLPKADWEKHNIKIAKNISTSAKNNCSVFGHHPKYNKHSFSA